MENDSSIPLTASAAALACALRGDVGSGGGGGVDNAVEFPWLRGDDRDVFGGDDDPAALQPTRVGPGNPDARSLESAGRTDEKFQNTPPSSAHGEPCGATAPAVVGVACREYALERALPPSCPAPISERLPDALAVRVPDVAVVVAVPIPPLSRAAD